MVQATHNVEDQTNDILNLEDPFLKFVQHYPDSYKTLNSFLNYVHKTFNGNPKLLDISAWLTGITLGGTSLYFYINTTLKYGNAHNKNLLPLLLAGSSSANLLTNIFFLTYAVNLIYATPKEKRDARFYSAIAFAVSSALIHSILDVYTSKEAYQKVLFPILDIISFTALNIPGGFALTNMTINFYNKSKKDKREISGQAKAYTQYILNKISNNFTELLKQIKNGSVNFTKNNEPDFALDEFNKDLELLNKHTPNVLPENQNNCNMIGQTIRKIIIGIITLRTLYTMVGWIGGTYFGLSALFFGANAGGSLTSLLVCGLLSLTITAPYTWLAITLINDACNQAIDLAIHIWKHKALPPSANTIFHPYATAIITTLIYTLSMFSYAPTQYLSEDTFQNIEEQWGWSIHSKALAMDYFWNVIILTGIFNGKAAVGPAIAIFFGLRDLSSIILQSDFVQNNKRSTLNKLFYYTLLPGILATKGIYWSMHKMLGEKTETERKVYSLENAFNAVGNFFSFYSNKGDINAFHNDLITAQSAFAAQPNNQQEGKQGTTTETKKANPIFSEFFKNSEIYPSTQVELLETQSYTPK